MLAIEVKQRQRSREQQTIVPRVIGDTAEAREAKRQTWAMAVDRERLLASVHQISDDAATAAAALLD